MATLALILYCVYLALAFGLRTLIHLRATGTSGFKGLGGRPGSPEWFAGAGFAVAIILGAAAPALQAAGVLSSIDVLDGATGHVAGIALFAAGLSATLAAQLAMGDSWRIGVDERETTELVTDGVFSIVRDPIFAAMFPTGLGLALLTPNPLALAAVIALVVALQLQVRVVEEPYLRAVHGDPYVSYTNRVGRFIPRRARHAIQQPRPSTAALR